MKETRQPIKVKFLNKTYLGLQLHFNKRYIFKSKSTLFNKKNLRTQSGLRAIIQIWILSVSNKNLCWKCN